MKADEPASKLVKFGMATDETDRIVECHNALMEERKLLAGGVLDHNLRVACAALAVMGHGSSAPAVPALMPVTKPEPVPVAPPAMVVTERAAPDNLRVRLGLR